MDKFDLVTFDKDGLFLEVKVDKNQETVWLTQEQLTQLFNTTKQNVSLHINNIIKEGELDISTVKDSLTVQSEGNRKIKRKIKLYNLDMIISLGYRVKSPTGITFRRWANRVLRQFLIEGYAINQRRLDYLEKQIRLINIATRLDENLISDEGNKILKAIVDYNKALTLLEQYDKQHLTRAGGTFGAYRITYEECKIIINSMKFKTSIFGSERDKSFNSSINAIYQTALGEEVYKTNEEKAANLLYFIVKNHHFIDGNKRIAASIFIFFLDKNNLLYVNGKKILDDSALVATTILIAESKPHEKEILIDLVMNFLNV